MNAASVIANICRIVCPASGGTFAYGIDHATNLHQAGEHTAPGGGSA
ncbi:hypothetical protein [Variovorax gossypii]